MIQPFVLYADCTVNYDGRAQSVLDRGNYLIIVKRDGSVLIHGADMVPPRNYMSAGSLVRAREDALECLRKQETIRVEIHNVIFRRGLNDWSNTKLRLIRTERELQQKLVDNISYYIPGVEFEIVMSEAATDLGNCDILGMDTTGAYHIIEVKRAKITTGAVVQLRKYLEAMWSADRVGVGYVAAPAISPSAMKYAMKHAITYIHVGFD